MSNDAAKAEAIREAAAKIAHRHDVSNGIECDYDRGYRHAAREIEKEIRALTIDTKSPVVDREAIARALVKAAYKGWFFENLHSKTKEKYLRMADAILALLQSGTGDAEAGKPSARQ